MAEGGAAGAKARPSAESRILVVDDDPHTLRHVRDALTKAGYAVPVTAEPGEVADLVRAERPGLVLLDLMLPGNGGIELMGEIPEISDLPVIFISGYGRDKTIARAFEAGSADYIVKHFSATELTARAPGDGGRPRGGAHRHRVRDPAHPLGPRRKGGHVGAAAAPCLGRPPAHRHRARSRLRQTDPPASRSGGG